MCVCVCVCGCVCVDYFLFENPLSLKCSPYLIRSHPFSVSNDISQIKLNVITSYTFDMSYGL